MLPLENVNFFSLSRSDLIADIGDYHCPILPASDCYTVFFQQCKLSSRISHPSLRCSLNSFSVLSSLPVTWTLRQKMMHHARLGYFLDLMLSYHESNVGIGTLMKHGKMTNEMKTEHVLEDFLAVGWTYKEHRATRGRSTCTKPSYKTKTIGDPTTPSYRRWRRSTSKNTSITQQYSNLTWTT